MINKHQCSKWKWRRWFLSGHCKSPAHPLPLFSFVIVMLLTLATCHCVLHKCHQSVFVFICKCSLNSWHHNVINWYLHNITVLVGRCWEPTTYLPQCVRISQCPFRCWFLKLTVNNVIRVRPQEEWSVHCLFCVHRFTMTLCCAGRFPNKAILKASLKAADENHATICRQQQVVRQKDTVIQEKDTVIQEKDTVIQEKDTVIQEKDTVIQEKDTQLQRVIQEKEQVSHVTLFHWSALTAVLHQTMAGCAVTLHTDPGSGQWGDNRAFWPTCDITLILFLTAGWRTASWPTCDVTMTLTAGSGVTELHLDLLVMSPWSWLQTVRWQNRAFWTTCDVTLTQQGDRTGHYDLLVMSPWL